MTINNYTLILIIILIIFSLGLGIYFLLQKRKEKYMEDEKDEKEIIRNIRRIESARRIDSPFQIDPLTRIIPQFLETGDIINVATTSRPLLGMFRERATLTPNWVLIENKEELLNLLQTIFDRTKTDKLFNIPSQKYKIIINRFYNFTDEDPLDLIKIYNSNIIAVRLNNWDGPILGDLLPRSCNYLELTDYFLRENDTLDLRLDGIDYIKTIKLSWNFYGKIEIPFDCALENLDMSWLPEGYNFPITMSSRLKNIILPLKTSDNFAIENRDLLNPFLERLEIGENIIRLPSDLKVGILKVFLREFRKNFKNRSLQQLINEDLNSPVLRNRERERVGREIQKRRQMLEFIRWINSIDFTILEIKVSVYENTGTYVINKVDGKETLVLGIEP